MKGEISITRELRPCIARGKKALFHTWEEYARPLSAGLTVGSHLAGQYSKVLGICELETGQVVECDPSTIRFLDSKEIFDSYCFDKEAGKGGVE